MDGLAETITDSLVGLMQGKKGAWTQFAHQLGRQMINYSVKQFMADGLKMFNIGNGAKNAALDRASSAASEIEKLAGAGITAATATVNAGTVMVNGSPLGG